jgi:hypothetical protein
MRILGIVALGAALGLSWLCNSAAAQQVNAAVAQSGKAYDDCVYDSVIAQFQQMPISTRRNADMSFLGEQGFLACATEERVLGMAAKASSTISAAKSWSIAYHTASAMPARNPTGPPT